MAAISRSGKFRAPACVPAFLEWLRITGEKLHYDYREGKVESLVIEETKPRLAAFCRLEPVRRRGGWNMVSEQLRDSITIAYHMGMIFNRPEKAWSDESRTYRFEIEGGRHWREFEEWWQEEYRAEKAATYFPGKKELPAKGDAAEWKSEIAAAEKQRLERLAMMVKAWRGKGWDSKRKAIVEFQKAIREEKRKEGNREDIGPEERTARCAMLKRIDEAISAELRGGALPPPRTKARPDPAQPAAPVASEQPPAPDPAAAEIWKPFFDSLSKSMKEKAAAAVPARMEETAEGRRLVLWLPFPSLGFKTSGDDFKGQAREAGFALDWLESGEN